MNGNTGQKKKCFNDGATESIGVAHWGAPARSEIEMDLCKSWRYKRLSVVESMHLSVKQVNNNAKASEEQGKSKSATLPQNVCLLQQLSNCLGKWATVDTSNIWLKGPVDSKDQLTRRICLENSD